MKKIKYGILCLAAAAFMVCMVACGRRDTNSQTQQNQTNTGGAGTANTTTGAEFNNETETEGEGGGAGSTGSTEGETGVIDGLIRDAEDGVDDILDGGQDGTDDMGRGPGYESSGANR
ncbi:MAG: hypothetical protein Q4C66_14305 [Lachnospiraceae bacterium]|nr:hypothetical protein [Lachnospiraceae bacterium]